MNRRLAIELQQRGIRVPAFDEPCGWCGKPSSYVRACDVYVHDDASDSRACQLALRQGRAPETIVSRRDSRYSLRVEPQASLTTLR